MTIKSLKLIIILTLITNKIFANYTHSDQINTSYNHIDITQYLDYQTEYIELNDADLCTVDQILSAGTYRIKTIVIDAGHGGHDTGCHGNFAYEKNVTLSIALKLGALVNSNYPEIKVIYTRDADYFVELKERANIANRHNADVFVSVHCNANPKKTPMGTETYLMGLHKADENLDVSMRENNVIELEENYESNYGGFAPGSPESQIIFSLYQNAYIDQSILLAQSIEDAYVGSGRSSRGVKQAGFLVLWRTAMPAVLTETGFLTNSEEESYMKTDEGQMQIAYDIFSGFRAYKEKIEKNTPQGNSSLVNDNMNMSTNSVISKSPIALYDPNAPYTFRIQFQSLNDSVPYQFMEMDAVMIEKSFTNTYRYLTGKFSMYLDAETYLAKVKLLGYHNAFIVVYKDGRRIPFSQYKAETGSN